MNRSTRIKACVLSVVFTAVLLLCPFSPAYADSFPSAFTLSNNFYSASEVYVRYMELNLEQQDIANYLFGMYNLFYLGSRGFQFIEGSYTSESSFIARVKTLGYRVLYSASGLAIQSRMDDEFLRYASSVLLYASQCNTDFDTWFANLDDDFLIPVDSGILNSFTIFYNDNTDIGISNFYSVSGDWNSGVDYGYAFSGVPFYDTSSQNNILNFVNTTSPLLFSAIKSSMQICLKPNIDVYFPNSIFILDGDSFSTFKYGYNNSFNLRPVNYNDSFSYINYLRSGGKIYYQFSGTMRPKTDVLMLASNSDLSDFIDFIFAYSDPFNGTDYTYGYPFNGFYPFIEHVILVDNLDTLSNPREVFPSDVNDVIPLSGNMITPIDKVGFKPKLLTTINLPDNTQSSVSIRDMINDDNVVDDQDLPKDPWEVNVIVQPNDSNPISIDVNMFSGGSVYLDYLWDHTRKVVVFAKDVLDCFEYEDSGGDSYGPKFAIYGVLVLGVAGGMIAKFLL